MLEFTRATGTHAHSADGSLEPKTDKINMVGPRSQRQLDRRQFLSVASTHGFALACTDRICDPAVAEKETRKRMVVDTHLHCFAGNGQTRFPYHTRAPYRPEAPATPQHLLNCMNSAGVDHAIVVHPEPYQDDHRYLEYCLEVGQERLKGTCLFFCDRPGSVERLPGLVAKWPQRIIAARLHAYAPNRLPPFGSAELRRLWKTASDAGLAMQLHFEPRYAAALESYVREFSKTTVIIDHLGRPFQGTPKEHAVVIRWSRFSNTIMKVSSLPQQDRYPHRNIGPVIKNLTDAFGAERMIYGGGFNAAATGASYRAFRSQVSSYLSHLSNDDQQKILGGTAAKLFGLANA